MLFKCNARNFDESTVCVLYIQIKPGSITIFPPYIMENVIWVIGNFVIIYFTKNENKNENENENENEKWKMKNETGIFERE